ncbi:MAG: VWA domain-containing protein [Niastella sp.]|nr:VWA domain-containing protein [Niastella sp.]
MKYLTQPLWLYAVCLLMTACGIVHAPDKAFTGNPQKDPSRNDITFTGSQRETNMASLGAVSWLAHANGKYYLKSNSSQEFYVYIQVKGNDVQQDKKRVPLNISLVLDRSGSMRGEKIAYARKAASFLVQQLSQDDVLSLVNYDNQVEVMSPSAPVKNKEALIKKIMALQDRGATNLSGGMLEGYSQVIETKKEGYVNRVLLMTDGLANEGITDPERLKKISASMYLEEGVALSTFGLGADYNEDLLTMLAETGRANYYFIDNPDKIPGIFATELKGLLSVVAQNSLVEVNIPEGLECVKAYGYPYEIKDGKVQVRLNDVYSKDEKGILFKFRSRGAIAESLAFKCKLQFVEATGFKSVTDSKTLSLEPAGEPSLVKNSEDLLVQEMITLFEATERFDEVLTRVDAGQYDRARALADSVVTGLRKKQQTLPSAKLKKQEETIAAYSKDLDKVKQMREEDKKMYQKSNKVSNYNLKKGKQ